MIVSRILATNFARYSKAEISLPENGIVIVTGRNGHGKSSLVEAVAHAAWNKNLRGASCWAAGKASGVKLNFHDGFVLRTVKNSTHKIEWLCGETDGAAQYATRTKSQQALEAHIGSFHVWRNACTFHTDDVARFTKSTDAARKQLLEEVLELDRVERGYRQARNDLNIERKCLDAIRSDLELARLKIAGIVEKQNLLASELEVEQDIESLRERARKQKQQVSDLRKSLEQVQAQHRDADTQRMKLTHERDALEKRKLKFERFKSAECPRCEQVVPPQHRASILETVDSALDKVDQEITPLVNTCHALEKKMFSLQGELRAAENDHRATVAEGKAAVEAAKRNAAKRDKLITIDGELKTAKEHLRSIEEREKMQEADLKNLIAATQVLSFQGVRAALLNNAVSALQELSNNWLQKLGLENLSVELKSTTENKSGKVVDKISFHVQGAGGGNGYLGASTGERRRIDIATMFALGELAADSRGMSPHSTLFVDEVFDGLDSDGVEAVVSMLTEISKTRCVVVITHSKALARLLPATVKLEAVNGKLEIRGM